MANIGSKKRSVLEEDFAFILLRKLCGASYFPLGESIPVQNIYESINFPQFKINKNFFTGSKTYKYLITKTDRFLITYASYWDGILSCPFWQKNLKLTIYNEDPLTLRSVLEVTLERKQINYALNINCFWGGNL